MTAVNLGSPARIPVRSGGGDAVAPSLAGRPEHPGLIDRFGRVARDLRVSVTEKCSLRCTYCMPAEGLPTIPRESLLTAAEIARLVGIGVRDLGVREVRFTGGEPLMRADLSEIVARSAEVAPGVDLSITTNGIGLDHRLSALVAAGLTRVNISLDTVDRSHFARLTRRDRLPAVLAGIRAARDAGLTPLKVNAVMMRDTLADAPELLAWALDNGCRLRFIEQMPLDADRAWARDNMVPASELLETLGTRFALTEAGRDDPSSPAEEWLVDGGPATVGIIASVSRSFCAACDRTRITAEGTVRSCLFGDEETDLRGLLRGGADDAEIARWWRGAMWGKQAGHGIDAAGFLPPARSMGAIGG
ncbi:cyclic pyranopterin monophosphate synthase [Leifsonia sp. LS1]|uniref:GTP 3',8-cyclase MoaA n=1 Tax=Leifsonia sp. LS1 TaxID=2828483 RepID=UPI001CFEDD1D|nr:GTP 3',8-cyclase MoaA [Leifsonia sp. LS1]GIT82038.1 cyclic pyranopterin monophosphate synthase [Leifsonia sp. LS1]